MIGVQLENEYAKTGKGAGIEHILELKRLAVNSGLDVPIYSVTGWDNAVIPKGKTVAVFGGYPDAPWGDSLSKLPPQEVYVFRFGNRATGDMGTTGPIEGSSKRPAKTYDFPFMTAEMGGGIQDTFHRRPVLSSDDIAAMVPVLLGSGVNLYGTYMFQGGENPDGKLTTLQESQVTGYPTDVPVKSYDFQAPLSEFGQERKVLRKLKVFDYFMDDFGPLLAPMEVYAPDKRPASSADFSVPRFSVRANGTPGFLFLNNYVRQWRMPERTGFQVKVKLPNETVLVPEEPITLPSGAYGIWPINMKLGNATLRYATAQPFAHLTKSGGSTFYLSRIPMYRRNSYLKAPPTSFRRATRESRS